MAHFHSAAISNNTEYFKIHVLSFLLSFQSPGLQRLHKRELKIAVTSAHPLRRSPPPPANVWAASISGTPSLAAGSNSPPRSLISTSSANASAVSSSADFWLLSSTIAMAEISSLTFSLSFPFFLPFSEGSPTLRSLRFPFTVAPARSEVARWSSNASMA
ncbi:hypothetical protein M5K25_008425 [Dendrobium thyrsiflorum]|uniref:Uncharacterized protein n=1 Tax=Dendrobium thyrsiflorum TaxID=117978 RepID=A0ABD0V9H5_DENTH